MFPVCSVGVGGLCEVVQRLGRAGVRVWGDLYVSSTHTREEELQLQDALRTSLKCTLAW